jgi:hypothetical protein
MPQTGYVRLCLIGLAALSAACGQAPQASPSPTTMASPAGTYACAPEPRPEDWPGLSFELHEDGTLTTTAADGTQEEGSWTLEQDQVVIDLGGQDDRFNIEGKRLVAADGGFVCVREAG